MSTLLVANGRQMQGLALPSEAAMNTDPRPNVTRVFVLGVVAFALVAVGWFLLSWRVMHTSPGDAGGQALGVVLALLVLVSAVGAIRGGRDRAG